MRIDWFQWASLFPENTGLPMKIWVGEGGAARHDARIMVNSAPGTRALSGNLATVAVHPIPTLIDGHLSPADFRAVSDWALLNTDTLVDYWHAAISTVELIQRLRRLAP
jgi:hypothetical protein